MTATIYVIDLLWYLQRWWTNGSNINKRHLLVETWRLCGPPQTRHQGCIVEVCFEGTQLPARPLELCFDKSQTCREHYEKLFRKVIYQVDISRFILKQFGRIFDNTDSPVITEAASPRWSMKRGDVHTVHILALWQIRSPSMEYSSDTCHWALKDFPKRDPRTDCLGGKCFSLWPISSTNCNGFYLNYPSAWMNKEKERTEAQSWRGYLTAYCRRLWDVLNPLQKTLSTVIHWIQ